MALRPPMLAPALALALAVAAPLAAAAEPLIIRLAPPGAPPAAPTPAPVGLEHGVPDPADNKLCRDAIVQAAADYGAPLDIMTAVAEVESGFAPWAVNAAGTPYVFADKQSAASAVAALRAGGVDSIDVGCMQVNLHWHPDAFANLEAAFEPQTNADYAASYLMGLYQESGDWTDAVANYHSSTPTFQRPYVCAVQGALRRMASAIALTCAPGADALAADAGVADAGPLRIVRLAPRRGGGEVTRGHVEGQAAAAPEPPPPDNERPRPRIVEIR